MNNPQATQSRLDLSESGDYSQYFLYSRAEILAVLRSLLQKGILVTVHFDQERSFFLTSLVELRPESGELVFDTGNDETMNARAFNANELLFTATVDKVKIQFILDRLRRTEYQGHTAFAGAVPDRLLRLQRREFFRLSTPIAQPIRLHTRLGANGQVFDVPLVDISGGGVGLMVSPELASQLAKGQMLENCRITLPNEGLLATDLCVRNMFDVVNRSGSRYVRVGCEYVNLSAARLAAVQRYILQVERERKARMAG